MDKYVILLYGAMTHIGYVTEFVNAAQLTELIAEH